MSEPDWSAARAAMMLDARFINLNTGSFGPTPRPVFERVTELRRQLAAAPMEFLLRTQPPLLWNARQRLAAFVGTAPERLMFTANVTVAMNVVASALRLAAPGEVLTSDHEYGSMHWCWERACQRQGLTLRTFPLPLMPKSPTEIVDAIAAAMNPRTRLLHLSHVYSATGLVLPIKEICAEARRRGVLTVVDGAHATAMRHLNIDDIGCDFYGSNCHKWLLAPIASGYVTWRAGHEDRLAPMLVSWGFHPESPRPDEPDEYGSTPRLRALEFEGTRDICPWLAVPDAIDFQTELGWDAVRKRQFELAAYVRKKFEGLAGLRLTTPPDPEMSGALTAFWWPAGVTKAGVEAGLKRRKIEALANDWPEGVSLRVSTHFYNTEAEIDALAAAVPELAAS